MEVFERKSSYDPRVDPIVRVEARRLRSKLEQYYRTDGREDAIRIEFVSGSYAPRIGGAQLRQSQPASAPAPLPDRSPLTLAVLPLVNLSANHDDEYFSDGMTEELIHALTRAPGMRVVAWNTALQLGAGGHGLQAIRERLNVDNVLTGSVRISGASLRVRAQLIHTETGVYLWSETFDREMRDVFAIQEEIARAIVRTLRIQLSGARDSALPARRSGNIESYDYCLKGRYYWRQRTPEGLARSVQAFEAALAADPQSSLAHAGLADAYALLVDYGLMGPAEGMAKAKTEAARALELDPELAEALTSLALIRSHFDHDWREAECLYRQAIQINPGYATAHHWLGADCYAMLGRFDEALAELEIARQLDPLSSITQEGAAFLRMLMRQYDLALEGYRQLAENDPAFYKAYTAMGRVYVQQGRYAEAIAMLEKGRSMAGGVPNILSATAQAYALAGDRPKASELLAQLADLAKARYVPSTCFAIVHLGLGNYERALEYLERGFEQHDLPLVVLKVHPIYDPLRGEPRFQSLLERLHLANDSPDALS